MIQETKSPFLKALEYIPLITGITIVLGCLRLVAYYSIFSINIFDYTELSDFISQGLLDLLKIIASIVLGLSIPTFKKVNPFKYEMPDGVPNEDIKKNNADKFLTLLEYLILGIGVILLTSTLVLFIKTRVFDSYEQRSFAGDIGYLILTFFGVQFGRMFLRYTNTPTNKVILVFIPVVSFYFAGSLWSSYESGLATKYKQKNVGEIIVLDNETLSSTKDYYYVGQTKSYVFFHNEIKNTNDIFQRSQVKKMTLSH